MSGFELKENTGFIFQNDRRENERQPSGKGSANIEGVEYWVSSWVKQGEKGPYRTLSFQRKDAQRSGGYSQQQQRAEPDDDTPF